MIIKASNVPDECPLLVRYAGSRAIASGTAATREPSRNLRSVSAVPASVGLSQGPSREFVSLTRNPDLAETPPWRFEPTTKGADDVVI